MVGHREADIQIVPVLRLADGANGREVPLLVKGNACLGDQFFTAEQAADVVPLSTTVDDLPAVGAALVFHAQTGVGPSQQLRPRGTADERGGFRLATYQRDDGAPQGNYRVTVTWQGPPTASDPEEMHPDVLAAQPNQLDAALADPKTTPITVQISRGNNQLEPFRLVRPAGGASVRRIPGRK